MKLTFQLFAGLCLFIWPVAVFYSHSTFDLPGSTANRSLVLSVCVMIFYPVLLGLGCYLLSWRFLFLSPRAFLVVSIALPTTVFVLFDYPRLVIDLYRDSRTEESAWLGYVTDEAAVYYNGARLDGVDHASFHGLRGGYARDDLRVYYEGEPIAGADSTTFESIRKDGTPSTFWRDANRVFINGSPVATADPATFEELGESSFGRDQHHAYFEHTPIKGADTASFEVLERGFARDKDRIYFWGEPTLAGADVRSFELIEDTDFARDASKVYALPSLVFETAHELAGADPETFESLPRAYAKDSSHVYFPEDGCVVAIEDADPATFVVTGWDQDSRSDARDKDRHYLSGKVVP